MLTESGRTVEADMVVVGAGVRPDVMLAERAGLEVDNGIICDAKLETSATGIFAAGDVCSYDSVDPRPRGSGSSTGTSPCSRAATPRRRCSAPTEPYREVPYFFSDLADWASLEYVGPASDWDEVVWRGDRDSGEFSVWYLEDGAVKGALAVGRSEDLVHARTLIETGADISGRRDALADADSELESDRALAAPLRRRLSLRYWPRANGDWCNWQHASFWY